MKKNKTVAKVIAMLIAMATIWAEVIQHTVPL